MGRGHKQRRLEKRARELEQRDDQIQELKQELEEENQKQLEIRSQSVKEKLVETFSDTDSGRGSSTTLACNDSPKETFEEKLKPKRSLLKGLINIGNTCFFNVIIQSLAHSPILIEKLQELKVDAIEHDSSKYFTTLTAQLVKIFDEFAMDNQKKMNIDPKPLFNSLIQRNSAYKGYDQHDTHELFMNLMYILRAEESQLRKLESKSIDSSDRENDPSKMFCLIGCNEPYTMYDRIFGGHLLDVLTCKKCGKSLMKIEPFLGILLPLTDRILPTNGYRSRRRRDDYTGNKTKKEPKILSRKQQKALKKHEKKNSRRSATAGSSKLRNRQIEKKKDDNLNEEETFLPPSEENAEGDNEQTAEEKTVEEQTPTEPDSQSANIEDEESEDETELDGPLTSTESTYVLADMVSKLTLIHENSSRPLPFVDEAIAQQFLASNSSESTSSDEISEFKTLGDCFQRYFKLETLTGENSFDCYYCRSLDKSQKKALNDATRQTAFFQLPPILPVFLKRFQMHGSHSEKIDTCIEFPLQFDLANRCSLKIPQTSSLYSLYAVIEHTGSLRSGHYVVYIKLTTNDEDFSNTKFSHPIEEIFENLFDTSTKDSSTAKVIPEDRTQNISNESNWYYISDNSIHKVPESRVLQAEAYVLFYKRVEKGN